MGIELILKLTVFLFEQPDKKASAIQGAAAGLGGVLTATVDLTAVLVQDFHMIQEIAFCYGYDPNGIVEKEIILRIIEIGVGGSDIKFKALALDLYLMF